MTELGGLRKHEKAHHALLGMGRSAALAEEEEKKEEEKEQEQVEEEVRKKKKKNSDMELYPEKNASSRRCAFINTQRSPPIIV